MRIDPADHNDIAQTTLAICTTLVALLVAHGLNRAYVLVGQAGGFYFNTGTVDYIPYGSDGGDFLATFIPLASAAGIETYAAFDFLQNTQAAGAANWGLQSRDGSQYDLYTLCPTRPDVQTWWLNILNTLLTGAAYAALTGVDLVNPQWGDIYGNETCWCDVCQAAFTAAYPGESFGLSDLYGIGDRDYSPTLTAWETWRTEVLNTVLESSFAACATAGVRSSLCSRIPVNEVQGNLLGAEWKAKLHGIGLDPLLDATNAPDEIVGDVSWQIHAANSKDYVTFHEVWGHYATRWWHNFTRHRADTIIRICGRSTSAAMDDYSHTITVLEVRDAMEAVMSGGALHLDCDRLWTIDTEGLWVGIDTAYGSTVYHSWRCEVQRWTGTEWRPIGPQAFFRTRDTNSYARVLVENPRHLAHFGRLNTDRFRILCDPAPNGNRALYLREIEYRAHTIQTPTDVWGGMEWDNIVVGLWFVRSTTGVLPRLYRINSMTGAAIAPSPHNLLEDVQPTNDLTFTATHVLILSAGTVADAARVHRFNRPATYVDTIYPTFDGTRDYSGIAYMYDYSGTFPQMPGPYVVVATSFISVFAF